MKTGRNRAYKEVTSADRTPLIGEVSLDEPLDTTPLDMPGATRGPLSIARFKHGPGIVAPLGTPPDRVLRMRSDGRPVVLIKGKPEIMREPLIGAAVGISKEQFIDLLQSTIQRIGTREATAKALRVTIRTVFKWQKGIGPSAPKMEKTFLQLQKMESITIFK